MTKEQDEFAAVLVVIGLVVITLAGNPWIKDYSDDILFCGLAGFVAIVLFKIFAGAFQKSYWSVKRLIERTRDH
jgi:hypothetical protein